MYVPPPGRPQSTPPWANETPAVDQPVRKRGPRLTKQQINAIRSDYLAGTPLRDIAAKHGCKGGAFHRFFTDLPRRKNPKPPATVMDRPERFPGESRLDYGRRVFAWRVQNVPGYKEEQYAKRTQTRLKTLQKKKMREARKKIQLTRELAATAVPLAMLATSSRPTFWQRIVGWFR